MLDNNYSTAQHMYVHEALTKLMGAGGGGGGGGGGEIWDVCRSEHCMSRADCQQSFCKEIIILQRESKGQLS